MSTAILIGVILVGLAGGVLLLATVMANRLVRRLARLREDTLWRVEHDLPKALIKLRAGTAVAELTSAEKHGDDEIGQVAAAFDRAQLAAMEAAAGEAATRAGFTAAFLNIAYRSQSIVRRLLKVLDEAENDEADPDKLARLFQLYHLATRERRNAENLIILGGGTPGRQWRNPVALLDVVRSAVSETIQFHRVEHGALLDVQIAPHAVSDVIHLLAELLDNAASFSPPETQIMVRAQPVGRGLVLEIEDQGLGMPAEQRDELNAAMASKPDFSLLALSESTQLGLFVVARLAHRHGIRTSLLDSAYGGVRAVVLVPADLLVSAGGPANDDQHSVTWTLPGYRIPEGGADPADNGRSAVPPADVEVAVHERPLSVLIEDAPIGPAGPAGPGQAGLPRRRRQDHLVPQLAVRPEPVPGEQAEGDPAANGRPPSGDGDPDGSQPAERSRNVLGALQRGTRDGRNEGTHR